MSKTVRTDREVVDSVAALLPELREGEPVEVLCPTERLPGLLTVLRDRLSPWQNPAPLPFGHVLRITLQLERAER